MTSLPPIMDRDSVTERLELIFPREAMDTTYSSPAAAATVAAMLYVGAVYDTVLDSGHQRWIRPSSIIWMRDDLLEERGADTEREAYYRAAIGARAEATVAKLVSEWGISAGPWYAPNTRETIRDDILRKWLEDGVVVERPGLPTSSSRPRWVLRPEFAALFDPKLVGEYLQERIDAWVETTFSSSARVRIIGARQRVQAEYGVIVHLPDGLTRRLEAGDASLIMKGVIEEWAPKRLQGPLVLAVSEPGTKSAFVDEQLLARVGIRVNVSTLLPDLLLADAAADPVEIWVIEVVHTDGEINESRKRQLIEWGAAFGITAEQMRFLTAFGSRNSGPAKRRLKDLAVGTYAWYLDEPANELYFRKIPQPGGIPSLAVVTPLRTGAK